MWLVEETDYGLYVLRSREQKKALLLPRSLIRGVEFGGEGDVSQQKKAAPQTGAVVELQYLCEIRRIIVSPPEILMKLNVEIGLTVCDYPFPIIAEIALGEGWTRDPFDRIIVAHAKANGVAPLLTKDELILANYPNARW